nr:vitamin D3 hydroxylase-associated protein-like isoform X1 [Chlorocebus sabaeus]XP_037855152.1 vitamin D3 hydroxylase-associated protein-like isoform X1 [Chlorocebus sabaeus]XP_037855159.1 vitamin D3 hydroxylase-associated protein-like isoform X1 [Chlorocebus sabaeus]
MLSVLSTSAGTCTERHRRVCSCVCRGVWDVMWSVWEWALAGPSLKSAYSISSLQEPALDPQPILQLPLAELAQQLRTEELSLESILCSYLEQALKVHQEANCLMDFLGECKEELQASKKLKTSERGLLYGVPMSLKDTYDCTGHESTCLLAQFPEKPATKDWVIVKVLKAQGAIPFVQTNVPQTLLSFECSNPIYGQTLNPLNLKKTCGGSSRGEGALMAERGSILDMGTDTGDSICISASFCGVYGLWTAGSHLSDHSGGPHDPGRGEPGAVPANPAE